MKKLIVVLACILLTFTIKAQSPIGAWEAISIAENGDEIKSIVIFAEDYQVLSRYNETTGKFMHTNGGTWTLDGDIMTEKVEFDTKNSENVGTEVSFKVALTDSTIQIVGSDMKLNRIDYGSLVLYKGHG